MGILVVVQEWSSSLSFENGQLDRDPRMGIFIIVREWATRKIRRNVQPSHHPSSPSRMNIFVIHPRMFNPVIIRVHHREWSYLSSIRECSTWKIGSNIHLGRLSQNVEVGEKVPPGSSSENVQPGKSEGRFILVIHPGMFNLSHHPRMVILVIHPGMFNLVIIRVHHRE